MPHIFLWSNDFSSRSPSVLGRVGKSWMSTRRARTIRSKLFGIGDLPSPLLAHSRSLMGYHS